MADLSGEHLGAACDGGLHFLKVSHDQLIDDRWAADDSEEQLISAIRVLHEEGAQSILVLRAEGSSLALLEGQMYEVIAPRLEDVDTRGHRDTETQHLGGVVERSD